QGTPKKNKKGKWGEEKKRKRKKKKKKKKKKRRGRKKNKGRVKIWGGEGGKSNERQAKLLKAKGPILAQKN
ncbi:hypothetical protein, partial [Helicobacter felis]|uniref:hypothetical protein n=1 Tax=Helicobacter felis TaxID=214 RepID=UPI0018F81BD1